MLFRSSVKPGDDRCAIESPDARRRFVIASLALAACLAAAGSAGAQTIMPTDRGGSMQLSVGNIPPNTQFPTAFNNWQTSQSLMFDGTTVNPICTSVNGAGSVNVGTWTGSCNPQRSSSANEYWIFNITQTTGFSLTVSIVSTTGDPSDNYQRARFLLVGPPDGMVLTSGTLDSNTGVDRSYMLDTNLNLTFAGTLSPGQYALDLEGQVRNQASDAFIGSYSHSLVFSLGAPPMVTSQPVAQKSCPSASVSFSITASGTPAPTFQWQWQPPPGAAWINVVNGVNTNPNTAQASFTASNATTATLTRTGGANVGNGASAAFRCIATNGSGSATSNPATLTICPADFNCSGTVTVQDIFSFLSAYFANNIAADFNKSGTLSVQDIFSFLSAYFIPC